MLFIIQNFKKIQNQFLINSLIMFDLYNALHTMPSGEHLTARKATKMRFIQLESEQLRSYVEDLESSLSIYKQMLKELMFSKQGPEKSVCDETETQTVVSPRVIETLISEKRALEERVRRITIEKNDAVHKARISEQNAFSAQVREEKIVDEYEIQYSELLADSEAKELQIAELEKRNKELEKDVEQFNINKENQLSIGDQKCLLYKKIVIMGSIVKKIKERYIKASKENEDLASQCKLLFIDYSKGNELLREQQREMSISEIIGGPNREITFTEFFGSKSESHIASNLNFEKFEKELKGLEKVSNDNSPSKKRIIELQNKIAKLQDQKDEYTVKINTISQEVNKAKRLQSVLLHDQQNIQKSIDKSKTIEQSLDNQLKQLTVPRSSIQPKPNNEAKRLIRHCYAASNPLDYAKINGALQSVNDVESPQFFTQNLDECEQNEVSVIQSKYVEDEMLGDSVILDFLKL
ncbi:unnamed protein product [Blepharisma stoltei]|uniref:Uncharacterized protein n=1 Tax=Blepharisma stoltei TaxID=1481888 RepID=A0AAU9IYS1_9CILI|nr:unnamed protein product [Blepharisma stoltei]